MTRSHGKLRQKLCFKVRQSQPKKNHSSKIDLFFLVLMKRSMKELSNGGLATRRGLAVPELRQGLKHLQIDPKISNFAPIWAKFCFKVSEFFHLLKQKTFASVFNKSCKLEFYSFYGTPRDSPRREESGLVCQLSS